MRFRGGLLAFGSAALWLFSCANDAMAQSGPTSMANPAAVFCVQQGGRLIPSQDERGTVHTLCQLPDGRQIEEWTLFRCSHPTPSQGNRPECDDANRSLSTSKNEGK